PLRSSDLTGIKLKTAKIGNACGAMGYFKKVRLIDFYGNLKTEVKKIGSDWTAQKIFCAKLEDIGGLKYCPSEHYEDILKALVVFYIGERSYGPYSGTRPVFFSNGAAPIITRIIENDAAKANPILESFRKKKPIKNDIEDK